MEKAIVYLFPHNSEESLAKTLRQIAYAGYTEKSHIIVNGIVIHRIA